MTLASFDSRERLDERKLNRDNDAAQEKRTIDLLQREDFQQGLGEQQGPEFIRQSCLREKATIFHVKRNAVVNGDLSPSALN